MVRSKAVWSMGVVALMVNVAAPAQAEERESISRPIVRQARVLPQTQRDGSKLLPVLYGTYATLQVLDVRSTAAALRNGAVESNPVVGSMAGSTGQFLAFKAATTLATIGAAKAIAKKNKKAAVVTMIVANSVTAAVVANNMKNARR